MKWGSPKVQTRLYEYEHEQADAWMARERGQSRDVPPPGPVFYPPARLAGRHVLRGGICAGPRRSGEVQVPRLELSVPKAAGVACFLIGMIASYNAVIPSSPYESRCWAKVSRAKGFWDWRAPTVHVPPGGCLRQKYAISQQSRAGPGRARDGGHESPKTPLPTVTDGSLPTWILPRHRWNWASSAIYEYLGPDALRRPPTSLRRSHSPREHAIQGRLTTSPVASANISPLDDRTIEEPSHALWSGVRRRKPHGLRLRAPVLEEEPAPRQGDDPAQPKPHRMAVDLPEPRMDEGQGPVEAGQAPSKDSCGGNHDVADATIAISSTSKRAGQTVAPFLAKHIPNQYAPLGLQPQPRITSQRDPNTKYCYRHRPDSKCRRTADEPTMENLQRDLATLSQDDQQGISHVWSLFSAAPAKHRNLMLQGILAQCCFPQLSYLSTAVRDLIRIDFIAALPSEVAFKILCFLDTTSLCKAAQVSQRWRILADDDVVWHKMCEQHIDRKCPKCGWGLPLLERKRLRDYKRQQQLRATGRGLNEWSPNLTPTPDEAGKELVPSLNGCGKRNAASISDELLPPSPDAAKRQCTNPDESYFRKPKFRPWKDVYKDRFKVGTNWKYGRCSMKVFRGHSNGVMCLQFDDHILATGSYDCSIKIWDIETGECLRTLRGHTLGIRALQFDDTKLISGSLDRTLKVWNWRTGECMSTYSGHSDGVIGLHFAGNLLASGSVDHSIKIWNFQDKSVYSLRGHKDWVNAVKLDTASRTLFSASDDCTVCLWDLDTRTVLRKFEGHVGQVQQVVLLPAEYEPEDSMLDDHDDGSSSTASNPDSSDAPQYSPYDSWHASRPRPPRYMFTGGLDNTIRIWDVASGRCLKTCFGHVEGVWALAGDTLRVVSGGEDRMVKVWDSRAGTCDRTFTGHVGPVTCIGLSDSRMCTGSEDCEVRLYSFKDEGIESVEGAAGAGNLATSTIACSSSNTAL
ncbi:hypothetical protein B7494_g5929 [Chlorociboria aeruginascens]|nr:hypothetical protein B7494_g5929 [Chlorociboria aeruginascens]